MNALSAKSEDEIRTELRGFPASAVESVLALRGDFTASRLRAAVLGVLQTLEMITWYMCVISTTQI